MSRCPPSTKSEIGVLEDRGSSWQEFGCLGNLSLYNEQLLLSTPLLKALSSLSRYPLSTKSSWRTGYASWRIQTLMEGSYTYFLQVHQVSNIQVHVLGLELIHWSCHQLFHRPLIPWFDVNHFLYLTYIGPKLVNNPKHPLDQPPMTSWALQSCSMNTW